MIIILQGKDLLKFNPINGRPLKESDYFTYEDSEGRVFMQLGDTNEMAKPRVMSNQEPEAVI